MPAPKKSRKLRAFIHVSLDGYFVDSNGDMRWAHRHDAEWNTFVAENSRGGGALVFGRVTWEQMASYWPTPAARAANPVVAARMTQMPKYVFSTTLEKPKWKNTTVLKGSLPQAMRRLKRTAGPDLVTLGSGSIVGQLLAAGLVDELQLVVNPIVLGAGRTPFEGSGTTQLTLKSGRPFSNGNVVLTYVP